MLTPAIASDAKVNEASATAAAIAKDFALVIVHSDQSAPCSNLDCCSVKDTEPKRSWPTGREGDSQFSSGTLDSVACPA